VHKYAYRKTCVFVTSDAKPRRALRSAVLGGNAALNTKKWRFRSSRLTAKSAKVTISMFAE
jgi:hypothetical protein